MLFEKRDLSTKFVLREQWHLWSHFELLWRDLKRYKTLTFHWTF